MPRSLRAPAIALAVVITVLSLASLGGPGSANAVAATPTVTPSGTATAGKPLTVRGTGFSPRTYYQLWWDASPTGMPEVRATTSGTFEVTFTVPANAAPGNHRLTTAKRGTTAVVSATSVAVGSQAPSPSPTPATPTITPAGIATAGKPLTVNGTGFTPSGYFQLWWDASPNGMPEVQASSTGAFQVTFTVPANAAPGNHRLTTARRGTTAVVSATTIAVVSGTPSPSPTSTPTPAPTRTPSPTPTPTPTATPAPTPTPTSSPTPTPAPTGEIYGSAMGADSMGNQQIGGPSSGDSNSEMSYRFRAGQSSALNSIKWFQRAGPGYSGGNGGSYAIEVRPDDGAGRPAATVLARTTYTPGNSFTNKFDTNTFSSPATLVAGRLYHIVFRNTNSSPTTNYISGNALWIERPTSPRQPLYADSDWAQLIEIGGSWRLRPEAAPTMQLHYGNGAVEGMGYMEVWSNGAQTISGSTGVREVFTVRGKSRMASSVSVRLRRTGGTGALNVRLETGTGTLIEQGSISSVPSSSSWVTYRFSAARTLAVGQTYRLVLTTASGNSFSIHSIREGSQYGFHSNGYFTDGWAERSSSGTWTQVQAPWGGSGGQADLQFYFR